MPPSEVACTIGAGAWSGDLQLRPGGPVFANVVAVRTTVLVPVGDGSPHLTIDAAMILHGFVDAPRFFMAKPIALGGFVVPRARTTVAVEGVAMGNLAVSLDVSGVFTEPSKIREQVSCEAVTLVEGDYDARASAKPLQGALIAMGGNATLSLTAGGPPVARLKSSPAAKIIAGQTRSGKRQLVLEADGFIAFGWVPKDALNTDGATGIGGHGTLGRRRFSRSVDHDQACGHELTVLAEAGGERAVVGTLKAGARFVSEGPRPDDLEPELEPIQLPGSWMEAAPEAHLLLRKSELADCGL